MESVAGPFERPCDGCLSPSDDLTKYAGDALCARCKAVFSTAIVLLDNGIIEENEVIPTYALLSQRRTVAEQPSRVS
jgi:hypothetical protein